VSSLKRIVLGIEGDFKKKLLLILKSRCNKLQLFVFQILLSFVIATTNASDINARGVLWQMFGSEDHPTTLFSKNFGAHERN